MSRSFVTNIQHFLDKNGAIPESMPRQARKFIENLGTIVACVTGQPSASPKTVVPCWNKINSKLCSGKIASGIDLGSLNILWHCLKCGDNGLISHWEHIFWDDSYR